MKKNLISMMGAWLVAVAAWANPDTTLTITAANLQDADANPVATNSIAVLVVDTGLNGFDTLLPDSPLTLGSLIAGDDVIVGKWEVGYASLQPGQLIDLTAPLSYAGFGIAENEAVVLYWFPQLTLGASTLGITSYGSYRDAVGIDGSATWVMPADAGGLVDLKFLTVSVGGTNPETAGQALSVVPEPSTLMLIVMGLLGAVAIRRR